MKQSLNSLFFLLIICALQASLLCPAFGADEKPVLQNDTQANGKITISTDKIIQIEINDATLLESLKSITKESKIDFEVTENLLKDRISRRIKAKDWPGTLKKVLKGYNYANSWKENKLIKVFIFEHGSDSPMQLIPPGDQTVLDGIAPIPPEISEPEKPAADEVLNIEDPETGGKIDQDLLDAPPPTEEDLKMIEITDDTEMPLFPQDEDLVSEEKTAQTNDSNEIFDNGQEKSSTPPDDNLQLQEDTPDPTDE